MKKVALISGANRGLGLECGRQLAAKGYLVLLGSRDAARGQAAADQIKSAGEVHALTLDVSSDASVQGAHNLIVERWGGVDVLVNNAGVFLDGRTPSKGAGTLPTAVDLVRETFETNVLGAYRMCQAFLPNMEKKKWGRIVNVSSGMGQLSEMNAGSPAYRMSKTALNALTKTLSESLKGSGILVNSVCPGWVKTDMGGAGATRSLEEGVHGLVWAATLPDNGPHGGFFRDGKPLAW
ncbi:MAG: SDR family oxidoreductase [Bdellovibrionales bacterium]|nr:SDR family oxidoreductase [Bdellovibrionales bacterium]